MMRARAMAPIAALALSVACSNNSTSPNIVTSGGSSASSFVIQLSALAVTNTAGTLHTGTLSVPSGGPTPTVSGPNSADDGGANQIVIQSTTPFEHIYLTIGNTGLTNGISGWWQIDLPSPVTSQLVLAVFAASPPSTVFDLQFTVANAAGNAGALVPLTTTVNTNVSTIPPSVTAVYTPNPAPYMNGTNCLLSTATGCLWEFDIVFQEFNGIAVTGNLTDTFTLGATGSTVINGGLTISIPPRGVATVTRNINCGVVSATCPTADEMFGGTYTFSISGTDGNGNPYTQTGPVLSLLGSGATTSGLLARPGRGRGGGS